jgi:uncharacterized protein (DUF1015 family)
MANVFPFRGYRYNKQKIGELSKVITEPYDKINAELQAEYYKRAPYNIVRVIKGKTEAGDDENNNQYLRAGKYLDEWIAQDVLKRDENEAIYAYSEEYSIDGQSPKTRLGFIALGELEEFGKGGVKPHERTLAGPKADRLNLMRATAAQFGLIFMLYSDPSRQVNSILDQCCKRTPDMEAKDDNGVIHRIWLVTDKKAVVNIQNLMKNKLLFIADGHHRYETALNYKREMEEKGAKCSAGSENYNNRMMAFVAMEDKGLTILPTHRLLFNLTPEQLKSFPKKTQEYCDIIPCRSLSDMLEKMKIESAGDHRFGFYQNGNFGVMKVKDEKRVCKLVSSEGSDAYKKLDVTQLHALLEHILGIDKEKLEKESNVAYERYAKQAVHLIDQGKYQMAIFMNPTKAGQVSEVAGSGERMPQKSTDFYPKLYTGLVINKLNLIP